MNDSVVGLSTGCFYQRSILDCLEPIRASGFRTIEICSAPSHLDCGNLHTIRRVADRIGELGLVAHSFHAPFAPHLDISSTDEPRREAAVREILQSVAAAAVLRAEYFVIHPGPEDATAPLPRERGLRMDHVVDSLARIAHRCRELGLTCLLENKLPHLLFSNTGDMLHILDTLSGVHPGACLDTGHAFLSGELSGYVRKLAPHLRMIHAHDNRGHYDDHLPPGDGLIDWPALLRQLAHLRLQPVFILELASSHDFSLTLANAQRGLHYLQKIQQLVSSKTA